MRIDFFEDFSNFWEDVIGGILGFVKDAFKG